MVKKKHPADRAERRRLDEEKKARKDRAVKTVLDRPPSSLSSDE